MKLTQAYRSLTEAAARWRVAYRPRATRKDRTNRRTLDCTT